ncbi:MAG: hypothetical protein LCI03_13440 [Actinobacteria bacterium]|nr:hypothetical protein [Actinomycetota bacterium]
MGVRGRIWSYGALAGLLGTCVLFTWPGGVPLATIFSIAGWSLVGLGCVLAAGALVVMASRRPLDPGVVERGAWARSIAFEAGALAVLGLLTLRPIPTSIDPGYTVGSMVGIALVAGLQLLSGWQGRRAAPGLDGPFYRPRRRPVGEPDDVYSSGRL